MKNTLFSLSFLMMMAVSCEKKPSDSVVKPDFDSAAVEEVSSDYEPIPTNCYLATDGKDSLLLSYEDNLGTVTGKLRYKNFQKSSNSKGNISGLMDGDTLKLTYDFEAEGTKSSRELWFLKKDNRLLEGTGKYDESGNFYTDYKSIKFDQGRTLNSIDCKQIEKELE